MFGHRLLQAPLHLVGGGRQCTGLAGDGQVGRGEEEHRPAVDLEADRVGLVPPRDLAPAAGRQGLEHGLLGQRGTVGR